jgi:hypothetical protein
MLVLVAGLALWRKWRTRSAGSHQSIEKASALRPRLSLATMMLLVVVVAVTTAVASRAPTWPWNRWLEMLGLGAAAGAFGLACVWVVCGHARLWLRLLAFPLLAILMAASLQPFLSGTSVLRDWSRGRFRGWEHYWDAALRDAHYSLTYWGAVFVVDSAIILLWLLLVRRAGWFDPFRESDHDSIGGKAPDRRQLAARWAAGGVLILTSLFPLALLYRLAYPPPLPTVAIPQPNGFDDLLAAGRMIGPDDSRKILQWRNTPGAPWPIDSAKHAAALQRLRLGLERPIVNPYRLELSPENDARAYEQLLVAVSAEAERAERGGALAEKLDAYWDMLRLSHEDVRGTGVTQQTEYEHAELLAVLHFWNLRAELSADQCIELAKKLSQLNARRESWQTRADRQRLIDANSNWMRRLHNLLAEWSGSESYTWTRLPQFDTMARLRILIVELGVRAYELQHGRPPATLAELVPDILPRIPQDPYAAGLIRYKPTQEGYVIYSAGFDGDDDGGQMVQSTSTTWDGDYTAAQYFPQPASSPATAGAAAQQP